MGVERIVVGIDFSPASIEAVRWTARCFGRGTELVLAHVIAIPEPPPIVRGQFPRRDLVVDTARVGAETRLRALSPSLGAARIWLEVREGEIRSTLVGIARDYAADLVAVGAHGEHGGSRDALGSTAEHLVGDAEGPVLLVTGALAADPARVVVAVDGSRVDVEALRWASVLARALDVPITVLHVTPTGVVARVRSAVTSVAQRSETPDRASGAEQSAEASPRRWLDRAIRAGVPRERVTPEIASGDPAAEIVAAASRAEGSLIVMGRRGSSTVRRAVLGSVTKAVLDRAPCPVLVVPQRRRRAAGSSRGRDVGAPHPTTPPPGAS